MNFQSLSYILLLPAVWAIAMAMRSARARGGPASVPAGNLEEQKTAGTEAGPPGMSWRSGVLLAASLAFYGTWGWSFVAVLLGSALVNWLWGHVVRRKPTVGNLWVGIAINLVVLVVFKYLPAMSHGPGDILHRLIMPLGVSFWTFQALSYQIDLYREEELDPLLTAPRPAGH